MLAGKYLAQTQKGETDERSTSSGRHTKGCLRPDLGRQAPVVGCERPASRFDRNRRQCYAFHVVASLTIPISVTQLLELARQLSPQERRALLDSLLAERFDTALSEADRRRGPQPDLTDDQIQAEVDTVRRQRRQEQRRAAGG